MLLPRATSVASASPNDMSDSGRSALVASEFFVLSEEAMAHDQLHDEESAPICLVLDRISAGKGDANKNSLRDRRMANVDHMEHVRDKQRQTTAADMKLLRIVGLGQHLPLLGKQMAINVRELADVPDLCG